MSEFTGYLIEKYNNMGDAYTSRRFLEEASFRNIHLNLIGACDTSIRDDGIFFVREGIETALPKVDFAMMRFKGKSMIQQISTISKYQYNALSPYVFYLNKIQQLQTLSSSFFVKPHYMIGTKETAFISISSYLGLPFVMKGLESSQGQEVFLIQSQEDYEMSTLQFPLEKEWLFEEYIQTSYGRDIRMYVLRGKILGVMERQSQGDFRANVYLGAKVHPLEPNEILHKIAWDLYEQSHLDMMGIDLLYGKEGYVFCEVNCMPGIYGMEQACKINVAGAVMDMIKGELCHDC